MTTAPTRYAELAVRVGANVQPGQLVDVVARVEHAAIARAVTRAAYEAGARYVDVYYSDQHLRRALIEAGAATRCSRGRRRGCSGARRTVGDERAAVIALTGDAEPDLLADLPGDRVGRARMLDLAQENTRQINERLNNWTVIGVPEHGLGTADVRRAGRRAALAGGRVLRAARRGRPGRRLARTCREDRPARGAR